MNPSQPDPDSLIGQAFQRVVASLENPGGESEEAFVARHPELRDLLEPMLREARSSGTTVPRGPAGRIDPDRVLDRVGPYDVKKELGRGGQAIVFLAEDRRLHRPVALKMLTGLALQSPAMRVLLLREAEAASRLDHSGICSVYDVGEESGVPYIAMRYIEGKSLAEVLAEARAAGAPDGARWGAAPPPPGRARGKRSGRWPARWSGWRGPCTWRTRPGWCTATSSRATS
jgi:hypothetical protein